MGLDCCLGILNSSEQRETNSIVKDDTGHRALVALSARTLLRASISAGTLVRQHVRIAVYSCTSRPCSRQSRTASRLSQLSGHQYTQGASSDFFTLSFLLFYAFLQRWARESSRAVAQCVCCLGSSSDHGCPSIPSSDSNSNTPFRLCH